jgi:hypothetical protein
MNQFEPPGPTPGPVPVTVRIAAKLRSKRCRAPGRQPHEMTEADRDSAGTRRVGLTGRLVGT